MLNKHIAVIGAGSWGSALANLLAKKGYKIRMWTYLEEEMNELNSFKENKRYLPGIKLSDNISFSTDMKWCIEDAYVVISAVPSKAVETTSLEIAKHINVVLQKLITVSKGLNADTLERISEVYERNIKNVDITVLSGPSHAEEVAKEMATTNVAANKNTKSAEFVQELFMTDYFRVYTNTDVIGVELGGALKNIIALCIGVLDGMNMGDNAKAALMTRGLAEITRLGISLGALQSTFLGLTGMGDLIVTATSVHSRNHRAGVLIGQGKSAKEAQEEVKMVVEGVPATLAAYKLAKIKNVDMPIVDAIYKVIYENYSPKECIKMLMLRPKKNETENLL